MAGVRTPDRYAGIRQTFELCRVLATWRTLQEAAEALGVHVRTVRRMLAALETAPGVRVEREQTTADNGRDGPTFYRITFDSQGDTTDAATHATA